MSNRVRVKRHDPPPPPPGRAYSVEFEGDTLYAPGVRIEESTTYPNTFEVTFKQEGKLWPTNRWTDLDRSTIEEFRDALTQLLEDTK
jgi:hypothetical protein